MKQNKIYTLFVLLAIAIGFSACEKEDDMIKSQETDVHWTAEDVKITSTIQYFQNKIKNNTFKSDEILSVDSAIWYMEAMLNFNYSTPDSSFVNLTVDTAFIYDLPVSNDMVNYEEVATAAFAMEQHLVDFYNQMPNSVKMVLAIDVAIKEDGFKDGSKAIIITTGYGSEYIDNPTAYTPFGADDYWMYGMGEFDMGGYCDGPNQGQCEDSDAAEEIQYKINHPNINNVIPGTYYTNLISVSDIVYQASAGGGADYYYDIYDYPNPDDDIPDDDWLDYLTLQTINNHFCLEPLEMNFYLQGNLDIIEAERQKLITITGIDYQFLYTDLHGAWSFAETYICGKSTYGDLHIHIPDPE